VLVLLAAVAFVGMSAACGPAKEAPTRVERAFITDAFVPVFEGDGWGSTVYLTTDRPWLYESRLLELRPGATILMPSGDEIRVDATPDSDNANRVAEQMTGGPYLLGGVTVDPEGDVRARVLDLSAMESSVTAPWLLQPQIREQGARADKTYTLRGILLAPSESSTGPAVYSLLTDDGEGGPQLVQYSVIDSSTVLADQGRQTPFLASPRKPSAQEAVDIRVAVYGGVPFCESVQRVEGQ
jgi:hypothetical protein